MRTAPWSKMLIASLAIAVAGLAGCESQQKQHEAEAKIGKTPVPMHRTTEQPYDLGPLPDGYTRAATAFPTGVIDGSGMLIVKTAPRSVQVNQPFTYHIRAINLTDQTLHQVRVQDRMPDTFSLRSTEPDGDVQQGMFTWDLGTLGPREEITIDVTGAVKEPGEIQYCAMGSYALLACVTTMVNQPALELVKTGPSEVLLCQPITYDLQVTNTGTGAATNVVVTDSLPAGLESNGQREVTFNVGRLDAGQSKNLKVDVRANRTGEFTNTATATADGGLKSTASAKTTVKQPVLALTKSGPERSFLGKHISYDLTITNNGDGVAANTVVTDRVPAGTSFVAASEGATQSGGTVTWNVGTLEPGQSRKLSMVVRGDAKTQVTNTATATAKCADDVTATAVTRVEGIPAILLEVIDVNDPVAVGDVETYVITVTNQGSQTDRNIRIVADLEDEMQFVQADGPTRVTADGKTVTFAPLDDLGPKEKATWRVQVKAASAGDVRFGLKMQSDMIKRPVVETEATNFYE